MTSTSTSTAMTNLQLSTAKMRSLVDMNSNIVLYPKSITIRVKLVDIWNLRNNLNVDHGEHFV